MSEKVFRLKVGKKGEIYTTKEFRELAGIKAPGEVIAVVKRGVVIIKRPISLEELLRGEPLVRITFEEAERLSEEAQREYGL